jgi:uncharacterized protein YndB with AHSA1/START domain
VNETLIIEAVRKTVTVDCSVEEAFRVFTAGIGSWWPTGTHSIHREKVQDVVFEEREGGDVYELTADGQKGHWARILAFEPPSRLVLSWEVGPNSLGTEVEVRFTEDDAGTRVDLEHRGWESAQSDSRAGYETGWDDVLGHFVDRAG